ATIIHRTLLLSLDPIQQGVVGREETVREQVARPFFFQAEDGIRDYKVTGVQTCALPIFNPDMEYYKLGGISDMPNVHVHMMDMQIGRASCRERVENAVVGVSSKKKSNATKAAEGTHAQGHAQGSQKATNSDTSPSHAIHS